ncbi:MAG TPA: methyltransferase domain-containing protein [Acidimicrobiales bacterium]|jgi:SAM-dependent methyltransferase
MSGFSAVDRSADPGRLVHLLDLAAAAESGIKHYMAAAHALRQPDRPILDIGCGAGHDLTVLGHFGLATIGIDPSAVMLSTARERATGSGSPLVRGSGEALPFGDRVFGGCRMERVLMHVVQPSGVLAEAVRCLRPAGLITVFEPDWSRFRVTSDVLPHHAGWISSASHPDVGHRLWRLLENAGCDVLDRIEELSVWRSLRTLERVTGFPAAVENAVAAGRVDGTKAEEWIQEQIEREASGSFHAALPKVLMVAAKRGDMNI